MNGRIFAGTYPFAHISEMKQQTISDRLLELVRSKPELPETRWQSQLSRAAGVPQSTISRIMGGATPELSNVASLAVYFGVVCEWLITGRGPKFVAELYSASPHESAPERALSVAAQALIEDIRKADAQGVSAKAFQVLRETLSLFGRPDKEDDGTLDLDHPPP